MLTGLCIPASLPLFVFDSHYSLPPPLPPNLTPTITSLLPLGLPTLFGPDSYFSLHPTLGILLTTYSFSYSYKPHLSSPSLPGLSLVKACSPLCTSHLCYHHNWQNQRTINVTADGSYVKLTTVRFTPLFMQAEGLNYCQIEKSYVTYQRGKTGCPETVGGWVQA